MRRKLSIAREYNETQTCYHRFAQFTMLLLSLSVSHFLFFATRLDPDRRRLVYRCADIRVLSYVLAALPMARSTRPSSWLLSLLLFFFHSPRPSSLSSFRPHLLYLDRPLVNRLGSPSLRANFSFRIKLHTVYPAYPCFLTLFLSLYYLDEIIIIRTAYEECNARNTIVSDLDPFTRDRVNENCIRVNAGHLCKFTTCRLIF